jgi:hypothetical protein
MLESVIPAIASSEKKRVILVRIAQSWLLPQDFFIFML